MKINLIFFAVTKDYFGKEMQLDAIDLKDLKTKLIQISPKSEKVIVSSKFALENSILNQDYKFIEGQTLYVLPPSSGG